MLLDDLVGVIETLKERIAAHGSALRENETRTRMALIDPLLTALGWDVSDPSLVTPEYKVGSAGNSPRADYGLLDDNDNLISAIEAKHLGESLANHEKQIFDYAWNLQIKFAGLTDGDHWYFVDLSQIASPDKTILQLRLTDTPAHEAALKLLLLWRPNLASGQPVAASAPALVSPEKQPVMATTPAPTSVPEPIAAVGQPSSYSASSPTEVSIGGGWIALSQISHATVDKKPAGMRFAGADQKTIRSWVQVLTQTTEWLCKEGKLTSQQCPVSRDGKGVSRFLVSTNPVHKNGASFAQPHQTSTGLFLETNHSARSCVDLAKILLDKLSVSPEVVEIRFE